MSAARTEMETLKQEIERLTTERARELAELEGARRAEALARNELLRVIEDLDRAHDSASRARLQWLETVDAVASPLMVHDADMRVVRANRAYARRAGMEFLEMIGRPYWECFPKRDGPLSACAGAGCAMEAPDPALGVEEEFVLDSGEVFVSRGFPLHGSGAKPAHSLHVFEPVTERKRAEQAILDSEAKFHGAVSQSLVGIVIVQHGRLVYANPWAATMLGYDIDEFIGLTPQDLLTDESRAQLLADMRRLETGAARGIHQSYQGRRKDGSIIDVESHGTTMELGGEPALTAVLLDVTERKRNEAAVRKVNRALRTLSAGNHALVRASDEPGLLATMCAAVVDTGGYFAAWVGYARADPDKSVEIVAYHGPEAALIRRARLTWAEGEHGQSATGSAIRTGERQLVADIHRDPRLAPWRGLLAGSRGAAMVSFPLSASDARPFGALTIMAADSSAFDAEECALLDELAHDLAFGVMAIRTRNERRAIAEKLRTSLEDSIQAIAATVETRDPYTAGHEQRVADLAVAIGRELGLDEERVHGLHLAGIVHDLGKISVPSEILSKPGRLNEIEYSLIKLHAERGYEILKNVDFPWPIAQIVLQHHERLDGSGYPQGLDGESMLLEARILAAADVIEAMASHRPYRPGLGIDAALAEISRNAGRLYDAAVVEACLTLFKRKHYALPDSSATVRVR